MPHINFELKAICRDIAVMEARLLLLHPEYKGEDMQTDTYFNVAEGRLKLREGRIENALIYYEREDTAAARKSEVLLCPYDPLSPLKDLLVKANGIKVVVRKKRKIYFIGNVKFHFDAVEGLGTFLEVEAIDATGEKSIEELHEQCARYAELFELKEEDYISASYSDMILSQEL